MGKTESVFLTCPPSKCVDDGKVKVHAKTAHFLCAFTFSNDVAIFNTKNLELDFVILHVPDLKKKTSPQAKRHKISLL